MTKGFSADAWFKLRQYVPPTGVLYSIEEFPTEGLIMINLRVGSLCGSSSILEWKGIQTMAEIDARAEAIVDAAKQCTCPAEPKRPQKNGAIRAIDVVPSTN